jgi:hypothetical protein
MRAHKVITGLWKGKLPLVGLLLASLVPLSLATASGAYASRLSSPAGTMYNSIPSPLPGNEVSQAFEATSTSEFGDQIAFAAGTSRSLGIVTVTMSSWGCESGNWFNNNCSTTPGDTFSEPLTFNIYSVGPSNTVGSLLATTTQTFNIPFRPSASASCTGSDAGKWYDAASATCFNGLATNVAFDFSSQNLTLPDSVIYGVAYNTTDFGYHPYGPSTCSATAAGCGYDSLNVGLGCSTVDVPNGCPATTVTAGSDADPTTAYLNSSFTGSYCDNGAAGTGAFRLDSPTSGCWSPYTPSVEFNPKSSVSVATSVNPSVSGQSVTFTATVDPNDGGGTVGFFADGSATPIAGCGAAALTLVGGSYKATCTTSTLAVGTHTISAQYSGDAGYAPESGTLPGGQVVDAAWPANVIGPSQPRAFSPQGFYIGVVGDGNWTLEVSQPSKRPGHVYAGSVQLNNATAFFSNVKAIQLEPAQHDSFSVSGRTLKFSFHDYGDIDGVSFTTSSATTSITFTLTIDGHPAASTQIKLGAHKTPAASGSPLTITR